MSKHINESFTNVKKHTFHMKEVSVKEVGSTLFTLFTEYI